MAWRLIDPRWLRRDDPAHHRLWYWDDGPLDSGDLLLRLDASDTVLGFELTHRRFPRPGVYHARWQRGEGLRLGEVDSGERSGHVGMSPIVRYSAPRIDAIRLLGEYFERNAHLLEPRHRDAIAAIIGSEDWPAAPARQRERPRRPHPLSGRNRGTGAGRAASGKQRN